MNQFSTLCQPAKIRDLLRAQSKSRNPEALHPGVVDLPFLFVVVVSVMMPLLSSVYN